ncbi:MAG TPA: SseB family protein [Candidatus Ornithomonoglobus merdipullorum]|uniref:SseB family protein n=1 Tax=Candidatus Ornithomonoglobus merdipullorum TaxID=2840895 RepID=A0A9D1MDH6_9FIRM|nr:SseB family protein [Candidatus Ornithomonoglobus merdipullorum]
MALFGKKKKGEAEETVDEVKAESSAESSTLDLIKETMEEAREERHAQLQQEAAEAAGTAEQQSAPAQGMPTAEEIRQAQEVLARAQQAQGSQIPSGAKVGINAPINMENLKAVIRKFQQDKSQENLKLVMECLQKPQTLVCVPAQIITSKENQEKMKQGGQVKLEGPIHINPVLLTDNTGKKVFPIFSGEDEIPEDLRKKTPKVNMPLGQCLNIMKGMKDVDTFALNPYSANIRIGVNIEQKKAQ